MNTSAPSVVSSTPATSTEEASRDTFAPPAVLLEGEPGTGKSDSLATIIEAGLELFIVGTEPRFIESVLDSMKRRGISDKINKLHYVTISPASASFTSMIATAKQVGMFSFEALTQIKLSPEKSNYQQFVRLLETLANFKDDRTGQSFGSVDSWGSDKALVIDSLSGINIMAKDLMLGGKPTAAMGEWGVSMDLEEKLINKLCSDTKCLFVLTAHVEREVDELTGGTNVTIGALGRKLAPKIPRFFSEVVLTRREGTQFYWSTITPSYALKKRTLPLSDKIEPSFKSIIDAWRARREMSRG